MKQNYALALSFTLIILLSFSASADYIPETLVKTEEFYLSQNQVMFAPVMQSFARQPPLYFQEFHWRNGSAITGLIIDSHVPQRVTPWGFQLDYGPNYYENGWPISGAMLVEYENYGCLPPIPGLFEFNLTRMPPEFMELKQNADDFCENRCGSGYEMTDFDMNQWRYYCYNYQINGTIPRSYNFATWGGSRCEKIVGNTTISCGLTPIDPNKHRGHNVAQLEPFVKKSQLTAQASQGKNAVNELTSNKRPYPPTYSKIPKALPYHVGGLKGQGLTFPFIYSSQGRKINELHDWPEYVNETVIIPDISTIIVTHWNDGTPINCTDYGGQYGQFRLDYLAHSNPSDSTLFGQHFADEWCQLRNFNYCGSDHLGMTFGHCRISPTGEHFIRATGGYCLKCV